MTLNELEQQSRIHRRATSESNLRYADAGTMKDDLLDKTLEVIRGLNDEDVDYVVIGGVALNLHGLVRATEDLWCVRAP